MCGIAGFFEKTHKRDIQTLKAMTQSLSHRGPDADGYFFTNLGQHQIGLGHRRLSIIDTSAAANQPMEMGDLVLSYNGEVYNFKAIQRDLEKLGYTFLTSSDTEVVLKAFHQWGLDAINHFRGMFALCVFNQREKKAYLIRDRVGVKPLYYYHRDETLIFGSEIRVLEHHPKFEKKLCETGLNFFLQYGYITAPHAIFQKTHKVRPGHYIEYDLEKNLVVEKNYWNLSQHYHQPKITLSMDESANQLESILQESFGLRMISDMPVGVFLSGGIDSSLITALLQSQASKPIETFTIGFEQPEYNESHYAREIAEYLGTHHHEQICTWKHAESIITDLPLIYDEPFADSSQIPTVLLSKFTKSRVSVALSGDGGDELFCGYSSYKLSEERFKKIDRIPFKKAFTKLMKVVPDQYLNLYRINFDGYSRYLKFKSTFLPQPLEDKYSTVTRVFNLYDINHLMVNPDTHRLQHSISNQLDPLERMMLVDFNYYLPDDLLVKIDRATMYHSLEGREPLLDHKILEFAAQLPMHLKFKKSILKKILAKYLPLSYFDRKKQGFGVPVHSWLKNHLRYLPDRYFEKFAIKQQGIFNYKYINNLYHAFLNSKTEDRRIWTLLTFQMWYEKNFNQTF